MAGGLLNIISTGNNNAILTGNPTKTFFKVTYSKYTNFGLQKFRIDYEGSRDLRLTDTSTFSFKMPRYAELLMDTYLVVTLPDIWSPIYQPCFNTNNLWSAYDFRWIRDLGTHMIKDITITCGSAIIQKYSGEYLAAMVERDFTAEKKDLFNRMTGNVPELYDPANAYGRVNAYPSAYYTNATAGAEPSIRGRKLYIPINTWFTLDSRCAFPMIALQYNELYINVTMRPIQEIFQVRDVFDHTNLFPYVQPDFTYSQFQMYRYLQTPPAVNVDLISYENKLTGWNADIHLISTYCFLSSDEAKQFAGQDQVYLVKDVFQYNFQNVSGTSQLSLTSNGMICSWMWYLQRDDVNLRNEWSNYTNWPYRSIPSEIAPAPFDLITRYGPGRQPSDVSIGGENNSGIFTTGDYTNINQHEILVTMGILLNGDYRENLQTSGVYDYIEKYTRTHGGAHNCLYCYNFCLNTNPLEYQPSGAINMSKFKDIYLEITTIAPTLDPLNSKVDILCDNNGNPIAVRKNNWRLYEYTYNMTLFEERYNILTFMSGNCGMLYAR